MKTVNKNEVSPSGGVVQSNNVHYLFDECFYGDAINITFEKYMNERPDDIDEDEYSDMYECDEETYYIGMKKDDDGLYDVDKNTEFSAVITPMYTQILRSNYLSYCNVCSPCFPNQLNLDDSGNFEAYALPPELYDDDYDTHLEIFKIGDQNEHK